jgi:hypothetical protein
MPAASVRVVPIGKPKAVVCDPGKHYQPRKLPVDQRCPTGGLRPEAVLDGLLMKGVRKFCTFKEGEAGATAGIDHCQPFGGSEAWIR